jgi:hypothetical protein
MTPYSRVRRTLMEYVTGTYSFTSWALGPVFPVMREFSAFSKVKIFLHVPGYNGGSGWGGGYTELQVNVNGTGWYTLGSSGFDGGVMHTSSQSYGSWNNKFVMDFKQNKEYTLQFRMYCAAYDSTYYINYSDFSNVSGTAAYNANPKNIYQHYVHIIVEELI